MSVVHEDTVDLIYESAVDASVWAETGHQLSRQFGAQSFWFLKMMPGGVQIPVAVNVQQEMVNRYTNHFHKVDILVEQISIRPSLCINFAMTNDDLLDRKVWHGSELYNDLARPFGIGHFLGSYLAGFPSGEAISLSFFREPDAAAFSPETTALYNAYVPHIRRAVKIADKVRQVSTLVPRTVGDLLEEMPAAVLLVSRNLKLIHGNHKALVVLNSRKSFQLRDGRFSVNDHASDARLQALFRQVASGELRYADLLITSETESWHIVLFRLSEGGNYTAHRNGSFWVWMTNLKERVPTIGQRLGALFKLTAAEQKVATALGGGLSPKEIAVLHNVSLATVRTQVQGVYGKLSVRRQTELASLLHRLSSTPGNQRNLEPS